MDSKIIFKVCVVIVFLILSSLFVWDYGIEEYIQFNNAGDEFCKENGYSEMTDHKYKYCRWGGEEINIECDNDAIIPASEIKWCIDSNKWGECYEKGYTFYVYSGNVTC